MFSFNFFFKYDRIWIVGHKTKINLVSCNVPQFFMHFQFSWSLTPDLQARKIWN